MKLKDAEKILAQPTGQHLEQIYIPSLGREVVFHPLTTADAKTLTRMNFIDDFDLNVEGLKLGLFDKLCTEDLSDTAVKNEDGSVLYPAISAKTITQIDYLSFLIGIRRMLDNDITYTFTCHKNGCGNQFEHVVKLDEEFNDLIYDFKRQTDIIERIDDLTGNIYKFELTNFTMHDYLYFRYFMQKLEEIDKESPEVTFKSKFVKPILYIKNIWLNDEIIEDWPELSIPDKLSFWNKLPPSLTINSMRKNKKTENDITVYTYVVQHFPEEKLYNQVNDMTVTCPKCGAVYGGAFSLDNFFTF